MGWRRPETTVTLPWHRRLIHDTGQVLFSLLFNFSGLLAGSFVASSLNVFDTLPWALVIYPGILSIRGAIGGLYSGRLSTALHLGTIKPNIFENTPEAYVLFNTVNALTLLSAVLMGSIGSLVAVVVTGTHFSEFFKILSVLMSSMGLSILVISPLTFWVSVVSYRRGLDPDVLVYPVVSTVADLIITVLYIAVLYTVLLFPNENWIILGSINVIFVVSIAYSVSKIYRDSSFRKTVKEFMITLAIVSVIVNVTGSALNSILETIGQRKEVFFFYPALIDTIGDVGSVVGSTATTKMALGSMRTEFRAITGHMWEIVSSWLACIIMFFTYATTSSIVYGLDKFPVLIQQVLITNALVTPIIIVVSFFTAIITRKHGFDPDNFIIPIETSICDGLTTIGLLLALILVV